MQDFRLLREEMVRRHLRDRGIDDEALLHTMGEVPREVFVDPQHVQRAYDDAALPIDCGQTISQPFVVALMIAALELTPGDRVLEVGSGSGYATAILARLAGEVHGIERLEPLCERAREILAALGLENVHLHCGDGTLGWPQAGLFDAVLVSAGGPHVPEPLLQQLAVGGRLVMPVGDERSHQELLRVRRIDEHHTESDPLGLVRFVPLVGEEGW